MDQDAPALAWVLSLIDLGPGSGQLVGLGNRSVHRGDPAALPGLPECGEFPGAGRPHRHPALAGPSQHAPHEEQPGMEDHSGIRPLDILKEGGVHRPGRIVEGEEDHPSTRAHRRGLGGDLDPGDPDFTAAAGTQDVPSAGHPEGAQQWLIEGRDMGRGIQAEDVELGAHPIRPAELWQPGPWHQLGAVSQIESQLAW